jgi:hypothetical protein
VVLADTILNGSNGSNSVFSTITSTGGGGGGGNARVGSSWWFRWWWWFWQLAGGSVELQIKALTQVELASNKYGAWWWWWRRNWCNFC